MLVHNYKHVFKLGFVVLALPLLTNQSPEEAILARLEELGTNFNQKIN